MWGGDPSGHHSLHLGDLPSAVGWSLEGVLAWFQCVPPCRSPREARTRREERSCAPAIRSPWRCLQNVFPRGPLLGSSVSFPSPIPLPLSQALVLALAGINVISSSQAEAAVTVLPERGQTCPPSRVCPLPGQPSSVWGELFHLAFSVDRLTSHLSASGCSALCW